MGLDVHTIPSLNIEELKKDDNLTFDNGYISLEDSSIMMYDANKKCEDYFRAFSNSSKILKYLAEKYDLMIGGDGFLHDAGFRSCMESRYLYDEVEIFALCVEYFTEEMLYFKDTYGWSDEFISRLEKRREEFKSAYEDAKKKIEEKLSSK